MRLYEFDLGSARDVLAVLQGQANRPGPSGSGQTATLRLDTVKQLLKPFGMAINTPDALIALKNAVDPAGDVISDVLDDGTLILKTNTQNPNKDQQMPKDGSTSVDKMASSNTDLTSKI